MIRTTSPSSVTITPGGTSQQLAASDFKAAYRIVRIYLKGASSEVPDMARVPRQAISPHVGVDMQTLANPAGPGALECVLRIALQAKLDGKTIFLVEVAVAGVFELDISNMDDAQRFVRKIAPSVLFPFARRDLASLTVAAGFQPVLLDHIDFDSLLAQVVTAHRLTQKPVPTPMRLDVIAAKPALVPPIALAPARSWPDTEPSALAEQNLHALPIQDGNQIAGQALVNDSGSFKRSRVKTGVALLGVVTVGAGLLWWALRDTPDSPAPLASQQPVPVAALPAPAVTAPTPAASELHQTPAEVRSAIDASKARLAEQPAAWLTLDLGVFPARRAFETLSPLEAFYDRPLFMVAGQNDSVRVLYGVFPTRAAAELAQKQLLVTESLKGGMPPSVAAITNFQ